MAADQATLVQNPSVESRVTALERPQLFDDCRALKLVLSAASGARAQRAPEADYCHRRTLKELIAGVDRRAAPFSSSSQPCPRIGTNPTPRWQRDELRGQPQLGESP
jgi:hypothetical protein